MLSRVQLIVILWTVAHQASLSMGFPRPKYWSGLPFPSPGDLPYPTNEHKSPVLRVDSLLLNQQGSSEDSVSTLLTFVPTFLLCMKVKGESGISEYYIYIYIFFFAF